MTGDGLAEASPVMIEDEKVRFEVNKLVYATFKSHLEPTEIGSDGNFFPDLGRSPGLNSSSSKWV